MVNPPLATFCPVGTRSEPLPPWVAGLVRIAGEAAAYEIVFYC